MSGQDAHRDSADSESEDELDHTASVSAEPSSQPRSREEEVAEQLGPAPSAKDKPVAHALHVVLHSNATEAYAAVASVEARQRLRGRCLDAGRRLTRFPERRSSYTASPPSSPN